MYPESRKVLIVAEISANHCQDLKRASALIRLAKRCGADAVKFQAYTPDSLTIDADTKYFRISGGRWGGQTLYSLYKKAYTPWSWFRRLCQTVLREQMIFFATAFDKSSVDMLEGMNVPFHKIASFELNDLALVEYVAKTRKPLILSTGMASLQEIKDAVSVAKKAGAPRVVLLKCVSSYPARPEEMNLLTIPDMAERFGCEVGLSDHTLTNEASLAAVSLGACIIEKHFTSSRQLKSPDSFFSIEPDELSSLSVQIRAVEKALGSVHYGPTADEKKNLLFRRSLFVIRDIKKGESFTSENIRSIRPGFGLAPKLYASILGKKAKRSLKRGFPLTAAAIGR